MEQTDPETFGGARILIRLSGDLATKARFTRAHFARRLRRNAKDALRAEAVRARVERSHDRIFVTLKESDEPTAERAVAALARVFGVQSVSRVEPRAYDLSDPLGSVVRAGESLFGEAVRGKRFAVRARRVGDRSRIAIASGEVERTLGAALLDRSAGVDLDHPEVTAHVELAPGTAYFYRDVARGHGGLPLGVEGRAVALVSGGFDSAVAAWQLMKRGVALDFVFCNLGGEEHQLGTLRVAKLLADRYAYGTRPHFHAIDFDPISRALQKHCRTRLWQVLLKRLFLRAAEIVAREQGAVAIITGDAVGQVSSQTLTNLAAITPATSLPVLRPLVGSNKEEIIEVARRIGSFELSAQVREYCALVPTRPATAASLAQVVEEEARLFAAEPDLLEQLLAERSIIDLRTIDLASYDDATLRTSKIPAGATVIDLCSKATHQNWHFPDALHLDFGAALQAYPHFDRTQHYVVYCEFGLKSAHLAELMRKQGLEASHFEGGLRALLDHASQLGIETPPARRPN